MKKITLLLCVFWMSLSTNAQIIEDFEVTPLTGWSLMQTEGDDPGFVQTDARANTGTYSFYHDDANVAVESTSWMISPAYTVSLGDLLTFYYNHNYTTAGYGVENGVWISTASADPIANPGDFTLLYDLLANASEDVWTEYSQSLDAYDGQTVYIAFKYVGDFEDELYIDTFSMGPPPTCVPATFTLAQGTNNCPADQFFIDVDITALNTATAVNILNDAGATAINGVDGSASPYSVGPFPAGTDVTITVEDAADDTCNGAASLTTLGSCPPDCATLNSPLDGATVSAFAPVTFTWTAPAGGVTPTSYNLYFGVTPAGDDLGVFYSGPDTNFEIPIGDYDVTFYWTVRPVAVDAETVDACEVFSFTSESPDGNSCLNAPNGQWPLTAYDVAASATCDGTTENDITTVGWTGEYSIVSVVAGENYRFQSSVPTDFVTIGSEDGTIAYTASSGYVIWTSTVTGNVRFYLHNSNDCSSEQVIRTRSVICGATLSNDDFDANGELFSYYPNPVTHNLTLNAQKDIQNVVVYNMLGQQVMRTAPNAVNSEVDMSGLNTGAYFVQVTISNTTETIRIIKN